jgi:hypothetical protein
MPDRSTKTTMGTEDMHERKVSVEPQDSHQDAQPRGMFHNIKVCTGRAGQSRAGQDRAGQGRAGQGRAGTTQPSLVPQTKCLPSHFFSLRMSL